MLAAFAAFTAIHSAFVARRYPALAPLVAARVAAGDAVLVKGSLGSRMKLIVAALEAQEMVASETLADKSGSVGR